MTAFKKLADRIDVGPVENFPLTDPMLLRAAKASALPSPIEATICAQVYARVMAAQG